MQTVILTHGRYQTKLDVCRKASLSGLLSEHHHPDLIAKISRITITKLAEAERQTVDEILQESQ